MFSLTDTTVLLCTKKRKRPMEKKSVRRREIERMPAEKWCDSPFTRETQTDAVTDRVTMLNT